MDLRLKNKKVENGYRKFTGDFSNSMKKLRDSFTLLPSPHKVAMVNISNEKIGLDVNLNHLRVGQIQRLHSTPQSSLMAPLIKDWLMDEMNANHVWCVLVPGYFYVFKDKEDETPIKVIVLQASCQVRPQVFKKPYIAPKMNMGHRQTSAESNSFQFLIENEEGKKFLFGVANKAQLDEWVESVEQSIHTKSPINFGEAPVPKDYLSPSSTLSSRSLSSSDLPLTLTQTPNLNDDSSSSFRYLTGVKKRLKPLRQSQVQTSSTDLYRLREEPASKSAASANDLRLSLPISMMQTSSSWTEMQLKNSINDFEAANHADTMTKKKGRFSLRRVFSWKKTGATSPDEVTLSKLDGIKLADHLYYKSNSKWTKVWCVLSDGVLYGFKANKPTEKILFMVSLAEAHLGYEYPPIGASKHTRKDFFIELTSDKKSVVVRAPSSSEQIRWIQALNKESMCALRSAFHNSKQESECSDDSACSMSSVHSIPHALASSPMTDAPITILPEINSSKLSSFSTEDNGYTTCSEDFDNRSSVGSQNEICDLSLSSCSAQNGTYHGYSERSLNKEQHPRESKMDFATPSATRPRSFSWNNGNRWKTDSSPTGTPKAPASVSLSSPGEGVTTSTRRPVSLSLGCSPQAPTKNTTEQKKSQSRRMSSAITALLLSPQMFMSGYLHRKTTSGKWQRLWFVLKGSSLFSHQKCESTPTVFDTLDLIGCHVCCSVNSEKKHSFEITNQDGTTLCYSAESEESMGTWIQHLHNVTDTCSTSSPSISSDGFFDSREDLTSNDPEEQRKRALKEELLTYVLQQIKDIQCRLKQPCDDNDASDRQALEDATCNMTRLVQRRMSTQIKLQSIKKQMNPKKSLFNFGSGHKKKDDKSLNPHLVTEAQELNEKLNEIDRTLNQQQNSQNASTEVLSKQGSNSPTSGSASFILSKSFNQPTKSHRLGLKPIWLRNSKQSKDKYVNNRLSTPSALLQTWGTELTVLEAKSPPPMSPPPQQDTFIKSLDLADGASKEDKPSENSLYKTLPTKKHLRMSLSYPPAPDSSTHNKVPKYVKLLDSEIEAFEMLASSYHSRRTEVSSSSNA